MAIIVVGGHARKVGKSSVIAGLISALSEHHWTAVKITQHEHGLAAGAAFALTEEKERSGQTDTSRYLQAGAHRALLLRASPGRLGEAMPELRRELARNQDVIMESNRVLEYVHPDVYLAVFDPAVPDVKDSARQFFGNATAVVLQETAGRVRPGSQAAPSTRYALELIRNKPVFRVRPPQYITAELVEFIRKKLHGRVYDKRR